jgi:hypothetical protein
MDAQNTVGPAGAPGKAGNAEFLQAVFRADWRDAHVTGFLTNPTLASASEWAGQRWRKWPSDWLTRLPGLNAYFSISLFTGDRRPKSDWRALHAVVLDDVGAKVDARDVLAVLGDPSWRIETSGGNEQWGYILAKPVTDLGRAELLLKALGAKGLTDPSTVDVTRYMRLPCGMNTKSDGVFVAVLREWAPERTFEFDELCARLGVPGAVSGTAGTGPGTGTAGAAGRKWLSQADLADGGTIVQTLSDWGELTGTRTGDGGWHLVKCPWDHEHTPGAKIEDRTAVYPGGGFKCWHGHCAHRNRGDFLVWFNKQLEEKTGGLFCDAAQLDPGLGPIDPATVRVPKIAVSVAPTAPAAPAPAPNEAAAARAFLTDFVWVRDLNRFFCWDNHGFPTCEAVDRSLALPLGSLLRVEKRTLKASEWFFRHPRRIAVHNQTYWPGEGRYVTTDAGQCVNRWRPCVLGQVLAAGLPIETWMVRPWLDLVVHVLGGEGGRFVVRALDWMSLVVAAPGVKPGWHLLVQGKQGVGKDLLIQPVIWATGAENVGRVSASGLNWPHNPWAEKRLVLVSELKQTTVGAATGRDQYTTLKVFTENTSQWVAINQKNLPHYSARNVSAFYVTSNEPDALALDPDDRRFMVACSLAKAWSKRRYQGLAGWLGGESGAGTETVVAWLRQRWARMSAERRAALLSTAPTSGGKVRMIEEVEDPVTAWTREQIEDGVWRDLMTSDDLDRAYGDAVRLRILRHPVTAQRYGRIIRALGGNKIYGGEPVPLSGGIRRRVWAVRAPERFAGFDAAMITQAYGSRAASDFDDNSKVTRFPDHHT